MKRFYENALVDACDGGYAVLLDGKRVKTPAGSPLVVRSPLLAAAIAMEWQGQNETIQPETMPLTRIANTAIDVIAVEPGAVVDELLGYGASDLLYYRAGEPEDLATRQQNAWDPYLDRAEVRFGVRPAVTVGIVHIDQPEAVIAGFRKALEGADAFQLSALQLASALSGSLILALALLHGDADGAGVWAACHMDETFQAERWGKDEEAETGAEAKKAQLMAAAQAIELLRT